MGRIAWAIVGIVAGGFVGLGVAYVLAHDFGRISLRLTFGIAFLVALAVMGWAHEAGVMKEPEAPPMLSLGPDGSSEPDPTQNDASRAETTDPHS